MADQKRAPQAVDPAQIAAAVAQTSVDTSRVASVGQRLRSARKAVRQAPDAALAGGVGDAKGLAQAQAARVVRRTVMDMRAQAKAAGLSGVSRLNKAALTAQLASVAPPTQMGASVPRVPRAAPVSAVAKIGKGLAVANPVMVGVAGIAAASSAYNTARAAGSSQGSAMTAGAIAAAPMGLAAALPTLLGRYAPMAAGALSKLAVPLTVAALGIGAARGGVAAYKRGDGAGGIAKAAALGAADSLTFGLASRGVAAAESAVAKQRQAAMSGRAYLNEAAQRRDVAAVAKQSAPRTAMAGDVSYKDNWTDSRGRSYTRQNFDVRKAA